MKKLTAALLVFLMMVMTGAMALAYTEGTYTATAQGNNGPVTVSVTFSADAITDVTVVEHSETAGLSDRPIAEIPAAIVENQSLAVDTVSGATNSSNAAWRRRAATWKRSRPSRWRRRPLKMWKRRMTSSCSAAAVRV